MILEDKKKMQDTYIDVFLSPQGKVVLEHMFIHLGMHDTTWVAGDSHTSAWNEGRRSVFMEILRTINVDFAPLMKNAMRGKT